MRKQKRRSEENWKGTIENKTKQLNFILTTKLILIIAHKTQSDQKWQKLAIYGSN
jgi:hypothetical protein